jgi:peptidylprolyl isomerase
MSDAKPALDPENTLYLDLKQGRVVIQLMPEIAPMHVQQIKTLARRGFYDGTVFHRVIEGFMAQGGDPTGTGTGGSDLDNIRAEFSDKAKFVRGTCGMARSQSPNSANSQFFIMFEPAPPEWPVHDLGPGRGRDGTCRPDQTGQWRRRDRIEPGQD